MKQGSCGKTRYSLRPAAIAQQGKQKVAVNCERKCFISLNFFLFLFWTPYLFLILKALKILSFSVGRER